MEEPLCADDYEKSEEDPWGEYMEDQITELINNLNPGLAANNYSLNSLLIRDRVDPVLLKLQTRQTSSQFAQNRQILRSAKLLKEHVAQVDWAKVKGPDKFHE
jgi:hypothetical protein